MVNTWKITIPPLTDKEERNAYIYLPESYQMQPEKRYPVLYMFDGHNVFFDSHATYGKSWGMKEYMDRTATQLIIVAVECNHSPDFGRLKEYSPFSFRDPQFGEIEGKGEITMKWMTGTLKPYIDSHYRTLSDRANTFIAGSSMGGLMSLYALLAFNQVYSRAAALSPSIWTNVKEIELLIRRSRLNKNTILYLDYGSEEMGNRSAMRRTFKKTADLLLEKQVYLTCRIVPGGTHCEASWEKQLPIMMNTLMYGKN